MPGSVIDKLDFNGSSSATAGASGGNSSITAPISFGDFALNGSAASTVASKLPTLALIAAIVAAVILFKKHKGL